VVAYLDVRCEVDRLVRTREEVDMQWARSSVSVGLPMSFFDNKEVRKAVLMTVECGQNYIRTKPGGVKKGKKSMALGENA
jgi:hypothetical protein